MDSKTEKTSVEWVVIDENHEHQRIDNFLLARQKGVPKSLIYRILRKGEVRVNKKRIKPDYKLQCDDVVRIPPMRVSEKKEQELPSAQLNQVNQLEECIVFEDTHLMVINKPSGIAVHGGSGVHFGVIEALRALRPEQKFLELVHRIDKETSGCLLIAKKRSALRSLQQQLREKTMKKSYFALVRGQWQKHHKSIQAPLLKLTLKSGERIVRVHEEGKASHTRFRIEQQFDGMTLIKASPITGRTHQIRVHCQSVGHPIAGDPKYSNDDFNQKMIQLGLKRLFLHAAEVTFLHPLHQKEQTVEAPLPSELQKVLNQLQKI